MSSYPASRPTYRNDASGDRGGHGALAAVIAVLLGIAVAVLATVAVVAIQAADDARDEAKAASAQPAAAQPAAHDHASHAASGAVSLPLQSFAGTTAENAEELAEAHKAIRRDAAAGPGRRPRQGAHDPQGHGRRDRAGREVQHLGVRRPRRARAGRPRPQGQTVEMTLTNGGVDPALDRLPRRAHRAERRLQGRRARASRSRSASRPSDPGVFMYHCGTKPVLAHIANGMYGAIVVEPARPLPKADNEYVLVAQRVVPERRRHRGAGLARHGEGARDGCPTGRPSTATRTSTSRIR